LHFIYRQNMQLASLSGPRVPMSEQFQEITKEGALASITAPYDVEEAIRQHPERRVSIYIKAKTAFLVTTRYSGTEWSCATA
jgi:hypothetical protein